MWRFDGDGRFPHIQPPSTWRGDKECPLEDPRGDRRLSSSPIVVKDKVFVTAEMGSLICLDVANGKILWQKDLFSKDSKDVPADAVQETDAGLRRRQQAVNADARQQRRTGFLHQRHGAVRLLRPARAIGSGSGSSRRPRPRSTSPRRRFSPADRIILSWGCLAGPEREGRHDAVESPGRQTPLTAPPRSPRSAATTSSSPRPAAIVTLADGEDPRLRAVRVAITPRPSSRAMSFMSSMPGPGRWNCPPRPRRACS